MRKLLIVKILAISVFLPTKAYAVKTVMEGIYATGCDIFVDTTNARVTFGGCTEYSGGQPNVSMFNSSNTWIGNTSGSTGCLTTSSGSISCNGSIAGSTIYSNGSALATGDIGSGISGNIAKFSGATTLSASILTEFQGALATTGTVTLSGSTLTITGRKISIDGAGSDSWLGMNQNGIAKGYFFYQPGPPAVLGFNTDEGTNRGLFTNSTGGAAIGTTTILDQGLHISPVDVPDNGYGSLQLDNDRTYTGLTFQGAFSGDSTLFGWGIFNNYRNNGDLNFMYGTGGNPRSNPNNPMMTLSPSNGSQIYGGTNGYVFVSPSSHVEYSGTAPTLTPASVTCGQDGSHGCGYTNGNGSIVGNDNVGRITWGGSNYPYCTITFNTSWTNPPDCQAISQDAANQYQFSVCSVGVSSVTFAYEQGSNFPNTKTMSYSCRGYR